MHYSYVHTGVQVKGGVYFKMLVQKQISNYEIEVKTKQSKFYIILDKRKVTRAYQKVLWLL